LLLWDYAGWTLYGYPHYPGLAERLPQRCGGSVAAEQLALRDKSLYKPGSLFHFMILLPTVISPLIFPAMWLGVWRTFPLPLPVRLGELGRGPG